MLFDSSHIDEGAIHCGLSRAFLDLSFEKILSRIVSIYEFGSQCAAEHAASIETSS